jgi:chromosome partitioning protein
MSSVTLPSLSASPSPALANPASQLRGLAEAVNELQEGILRVVFEPEAKKQLRLFSAREAARWLGLSVTRLRDVCAETGLVPEEQRAMGPRNGLFLSAEQLHAVRTELAASSSRRGAAVRRYRPRREGGERLQTLASMIFKGGTGKTTLAVHFAQYLALRGYRMLLVDLDPQASATTLFGINPAVAVADHATFYGFVCGERRFTDLIVRTYWPGLDLVPANLSLALTDFEIAGRAKLNRRPIHGYLSEALDEIQEQYDVILLDCRPDLGMTTLNALLAASGILVPVTMSQLDIASMGEFFRFSAFLLEQLPELGLPAELLAFDFVKLVINRFDPAQAAQAQVRHWLLARMAGWVVEMPMLQTAALGHAGAQWQTLYEYEPDEGRRRAYNRALEALDAVCFELEAILWRTWGRPGTPVRPLAEAGLAE